jgi:putative methionine-R-sulfoxide reductase with GAF domain
LTLRGRVSDAELFDAFARSHVIVLPSNTRAEGFGLVLLEGMVAGCVPLVSQLPGVTDVVGDAGFSFPVGDEAALASLLVCLRDNPNLLNVYSARARERARQYSWQRTVYWHQALYQRLVAMQRFSDNLHTNHDQGQALDILLEETISTLSASAGSIMLVKPADQILRLEAARGLSKEARHSSQPLGHGIAGIVATCNVPLRLPQAFDSFATGALAQYQQRDEIQSALSVPMRAQDRTVGVLNVSSLVAERQFSEDDLAWLNTVATEAARVLVRYQPGLDRVNRQYSRPLQQASSV